MKRKLLLGVLLASMGLMAISGCGKKGWKEPDMSRTYEKVASSTLYVDKVENLSDDFILGMDSSCVPSLEKSGVEFYDFQGNKSDVFQVLSDNGINYIRVRIWNNPFNKDGKGYGGGNCDLQNAIEIGKRATKYKMRLLVDFHYSDFWADPAKQMAPKAWENMKLDEKKEALYKFTKESLQELQKNNIAVGMVQIGNETNGGKMAGVNTEGAFRFSAFSELVNEGSKAVREVYPNALVAVHFANPENRQDYLNWAKFLKRDNVDYDVFASSYYPYWHGTMENLSGVLDEVAKTYDKKVMVVETSYAYTAKDTDFFGNSIGDDALKLYPFSVAGQANHVRNMVDLVANHMTNGIGLCYWEGTWISVNAGDYDGNKILWEKYGSGWATSYAAEYDPEDAGKYYGGSAVDNQAFFDENGKPLESLKVWNLVRFGNQAPEYVDGIEDAYVQHYTYEDFTLPETVNVIYNSNRKVAIPVTWEAFDIEAAKALGNGTHTINGVADGKPVKCYLTMMERNFLKDYSFEEGGEEAWTINNKSASPISSAYQAGFAKKGKDKNNPRTGDWSIHFWGSSADLVNFEVEQTLTLETSGTYKFTFYIMGGGNGSATADESLMNCYGYVKVGETTLTQKVVFTNYNDGFVECKILDIPYEAGQEITVGAHIESSEAGVWGDADDFMLNMVL